LREWGNGWPKDAPLRFVYMDRYQAELFGPDRGKVVFLSQVLPAQSAIGYDQLGYLIIDKVNNKPIRGIADLDAALETPVNGFHKIEFTTDPRTIYLDAATIGKDTESVQKQYGLPITSRLSE
jgi:PDZ domain-containing protein